MTSPLPFRPGHCGYGYSAHLNRAAHWAFRPDWSPERRAARLDTERAAVRAVRRAARVAQVSGPGIDATTPAPVAPEALEPSVSAAIRLIATTTRPPLFSGGTAQQHLQLQLQSGLVTGTSFQFGFNNTYAPHNGTTEFSPSSAPTSRLGDAALLQGAASGQQALYLSGRQ